jgi:hypothetical protein
MNKYNVKVLSDFTSNENKTWLYMTIVDYFKDKSVARIVSKTIHGWLWNFAKRMEQEMMYSEAVVETDIRSQVNCLNDTFIAETIEMIKRDLLQADLRDDLTNNNLHHYNDGRAVRAQSAISRMPRQVVNDRDSSCVKMVPGRKPGPATTQEILESWRYTARGRNIREDVAGDGDSDDMLASGERANIAVGQGFYFQGGVDGEHDRHGVEAVRENTNNHSKTMMSDPKVQSLNQGGNGSGSSRGDPKLWNNAWSVVDESNEAERTRYANQRITRSYNGGTGDSAADQVPWWRRSIQHRHVDMTAKDALSGYVERDCHVRGYDMSSLYCRVADNQRQHREDSVYPFSFRC